VPTDEGVELFRRELAEGDHSAVALCGDPLSHPSVEERLSLPPWSRRRVTGATVGLTTIEFDDRDPFLDHHRLRGTPVLPAVMALELSADGVPWRSPSLVWEDMVLHSMVILRDESMTLDLKLSLAGAGEAFFEGRHTRRSRGPDFSGKLRWRAGDLPDSDLPEAGEVLREYRPDELYGEKGLVFSGPLFHALQGNLVIYPGLVSALLGEPSEFLDRERRWRPTLPVGSLDGLMQMAALYCHAHEQGLFLPVGIDYLGWSGEDLRAGPLQGFIWPLSPPGEKIMSFNGILRNGKGSPAVNLRGLKMARASGLNLTPSTEEESLTGEKRRR
jgi:hypothetical protein